MALVPPPSYAVVEDGVHRCAMPGAGNISFLSSLGARTAIILSNEPLEGRVADVLEKEGVQVVPLGREHWVPDPAWTGLSELLVKEAVEILLDVSRHPVVLACSTGLHITGAVVACLRKLQQWATYAVMEEYRAFAEPHHRTKVMHFIEAFDVDVISGQHGNFPAWHLSHLAHMRGDQVFARSDGPRPPYQSYFFTTGGLTVTDKTSYDAK